MGTKNDPSKYDCLAKAHPDEPYFVLIGRDPSAAVLLRLWALIRQRNHTCGDSEEKIAEALEIANDMELWHQRHGNKPLVDLHIVERLFVAASEGLIEHPEGFDWPCDCNLCRSYA